MLAIIGIVVVLLIVFWALRMIFFVMRSRDPRRQNRWVYHGWRGMKAIEREEAIQRHNKNKSPRTEEEEGN